MNNSKPFPVMGPRGHGCPAYVEWGALNETIAMSNHGQTLAKLASRGGLGVEEIYAIRHCITDHFKKREITVEQGTEECIKIAYNPDSVSVIERLREDNERISLELLALKERLELPEGIEHLKIWRDECDKRDESSKVLDSDIVAIIDRVAIYYNENMEMRTRLAIAPMIVDTPPPENNDNDKK